MNAPRRECADGNIFNAREVQMQVVREQSSDVMLKPKFLTPEAGLRLQSGPGRDLIF